MTSEEFTECRDSLKAPAHEYVLLVMFAYYNHLVGTHLLRAGFVVRWTDTLEGAEARIQAACPGVVICWIGKEELAQSPPDGLTLLRRMQTPEFGHVLSIAVVQTEEHEAQAAAAGAKAVLVPPFAPSDLVRYVEQRLPISK